MLDRFGVIEEALRPGIHPNRPHAGIRIERVGVWAEGLTDVVLEEAVDEDHIPARQFLAARHPLPDELAVVNNELDVEALHPAAGLALAAVGFFDVAEPLAERKIALLNRIRGVPRQPCLRARKQMPRRLRIWQGGTADAAP